MVLKCANAIFGTSIVINLFTFRSLISRFPFDAKNPRAYLIFAVYQYTAVVCNFLLLASCLCIGLGVYLFLVTVITDIKRNFRSINERAKKTRRNQPQMTFNQLAETIQLHSDSKQLLSTRRNLKQKLFLIHIYFQTN